MERTVVVVKPDGMVVEFTASSAINAYHHYRCEFESRSSEMYSIQHYVIKVVSDLRQVGGFHWVLRFPPPIKLTLTLDIMEINFKYSLIIECQDDRIREYADVGRSHPPIISDIV